MSPKFVKKYMRLAQFVGNDQNPCLSRGIGSVIVDPVRNREVSTGYNGPAKGVPHMDSFESLKEFIYPQLSEKDKEYIYDHNECIGKNYVQPWDVDAEDFAKAFEGCKTCPRKLVGAKSGERLDLCGCAHSERNALLNATCDVTGFYLFTYCGTPCLDCTVEIINKGIGRVYCLAEDSGPKDNKYFSWRSEWKFVKAGVEVIKLDKEWIHSNVQ